MLSVMFSVVIFTLPGIAPAGFDRSWIAVPGALVLISFLFRRSLHSAVSGFFDRQHAFGRVLLAFHGILFLALFQMFALLRAADTLLSFTTGEPRNTTLIATVVVAGLAALVGSRSLLRVVSRAAGVSLFAGLVLLIVAQTVYQHPFIPAITSPLIPSVESAGSGLLSAAYLVLLTVVFFWLAWLELGRSERADRVEREVTMVRAAGGVVTMSAGVFLFAMTPAVPAGISSGTAAEVLAQWVTLFLSGGLAGLFVMTVSAAGALFSHRLYPAFSTAVTEEKQALVQKLTIVATVVAAVLLVPIERSLGESALVWYAGSVFVFVVPIVTVFVIDVASVKRHPFVMAVAMFLGGIVGAVSMATAGAEWNAVITATEGSAATLLVYLILGKAGDLLVVQRLLARRQML